MHFDYSTFKQEFRVAAKARGIDPQRGISEAQYAAAKLTTFQAALEDARNRTFTHYQRAALDFDEHLQKHKFQFVTDEQVQMMRKRDWWTQDAEMWRCGKETLRSAVENAACRALYHECKRLEGRKDEPSEAAWKSVWKEEALTVAAAGRVRSRARVTLAGMV